MLAVFGWDAIYAALSETNSIPFLLHAAGVTIGAGALSLLLFGSSLSFWATLFTVLTLELAFVYGLEPLYGGSKTPATPKELANPPNPFFTRDISLY